MTRAARYDKISACTTRAIRRKGCDFSVKQTFLKGLRHGLPIGLGYLSVSFAFGIKAVSDGLLPVQAVLISMTNLTSAIQSSNLLSAQQPQSQTADDILAAIIAPPKKEEK